MDKNNFRVAFFLSTLGGGGAERVTLNLASNMASKGMLIDLVVASAKGKLKDAVPGNVHLIDLGKSRVSLSIFDLAAYYRMYKPTIVVSAQYHVNIISIIAKIFSSHKPKIVAVVHNTLSMEMNNVYHKFISSLIPFVYRFASSIVAVSNGVANDFSEVTGIPRNKIKVIYNPVVTILMKEYMKCEVYDNWIINKTVPVVIAIGRLTRQKNFSFLLKAFNEYVKYQPARLIILGDGEDRKMLEHYIIENKLQETVKLPGFVSNPYAYLAGADLFVLSSDWEGLPTVLIEAMACGTPTISTRCKNGPEEILQNGRYGMLVDVGNVEQMTAAMLKMLTTEALKIDESAWVEYTEEVACNNYINHISSL